MKSGQPGACKNKYLDVQMRNVIAGLLCHLITWEENVKVRILPFMLLLLGNY